MRRPALSRPLLGGVEQQLAGAFGAALGIDDEVLDPAPAAEAD
jgi:hypothetical protein